MTTQEARQALIDKDPSRSYLVTETVQYTQHEFSQPSCSIAYDIHAFEPGAGMEIQFSCSNADLPTALNQMLTNLDLASVPCNP